MSAPLIAFLRAPDAADLSRGHNGRSLLSQEQVATLIDAAEALIDLAFENRIRGLGDAASEVADPTGVLARTRVAIRNLRRD